MADPVRVVIADDDVLLREGLASLLERAGFDVVAQAGDGPQLLELVRREKPEFVVADIRMPPTHTTEGLDAARVIREEMPDTAVLVLSAHVDIEDAMELLASGHRIGYLLKSRITDVADFIESVESIARGASIVDPALVAGTRLRPSPQRPAVGAQRPGARGAGADGGGTVQRRHRPAPLGHRGHRRETRAQHSDQARPGGNQRRPPQGVSGDHLP